MKIIKKFKYNSDIYNIVKSNRKNKKYDVYKNDKYNLSFGDSRYQQYHDKLGEYTNLDHNDMDRRKLYYARHGDYDKPMTAKYFSHTYLW